MTEQKQNDTLTPEQPSAAMAADQQRDQAEAETGADGQTRSSQTAANAEMDAAAQLEAGTVAEQPAAPTAEETIAQLQEELALAQARADEYLDRLQRTAAEFQNSRRRQEKQLADQIERASLHIIQLLLPILDDLDRAFQNVPADLSSPTEAELGAQSQAAWVDGFRQIQKKLHALVEDQGVEPIPLEGPFDPTRHEAISSEPNDEVESGHIIETLRVGYEHKGRVIRPALVRTAL